MRRLTLSIALLAACQGSRSTPAGSGSAIGAPAKNPRIPPNPRRTTSPPSLAQSALAVGQQAPAIALADTTGTEWTLAGALSRHTRVMLVFYRGDW
ncbi:MAG: hypothetical protein ABI678_19630 [Kofleriaceae bacterium]